MAARKLTSPNCVMENGSKKDATVLYTVMFPNHDVLPHIITSCQTDELNTPDATTKSYMRQMSEDYIFDATGLITKVNDDDLQYVSVAMQDTVSSTSGEEMMQRKMTSSCAPHYDLNRVTSYNHYSCNYLGTGIDESGRTVRNPMKTWKGMIASCDNSIEISQNTEEDIKKVVFERAGGDESKMNIDEFICNIYSIPIM